MSEMGVTWDAATFLPPPRPRGAVSGPWPIETGAHQMAVASLSLCLRLNRNFSYKMQSPAPAPPPTTRALGWAQHPWRRSGTQGPSGLFGIAHCGLPHPGFQCP